MRKPIQIGCVAFLVGLVGIGMLHRYRAEKSERTLEMAVEEINQTLPQMVNKNTRFNSVTLDEGRVIRYNLTVIGLTADRINRDQLDKSLRPKLINALRTKPEARVFGDLGVTIVLSYKDMNGTFIAQFQITPEEYRE